MIPRKLLLPFAALALAGAATAEPPFDAAVANRIRADVQFLASDELEGRDTGSHGYRIAAQYVASQFAGLGLKPGGTDGGWFQEVPFRRATHQSAPTLALIEGGKRIELEIGKDAGLKPSLVQKVRKMELGLVFAGRGINDPALGINDYAGVDARGKIAVIFAGTPHGLAGDVAAHLVSSKEAMAKRAGAIGLIELPVPGAPSYRGGVKSNGLNPILDWVDKDGRTGDAGQLLVELAVAKGLAPRLFAGSSHGLDRLVAMTRNGKRLPAFPLRARIAVDSTSAWQDFTSPEVIGVLPGSDPRLASEHVVLMAHLDHVGVKADAKPGEDRIYNGALDNGAGVATMLEAARKFSGAPNKPRRSVMFIANTGEERGLLGADYFANHPTVPANTIVGLVDLDMPLLLYDFTDVAAFGAEHSTIARTAEAAGRSLGIQVSPDPMPEETLFVRSDHYRFVLRGVPAVFLMTGHANGGKKAYAQYFARTHHQPTDDMSQPIRWGSGARYAELNYRIARAMADDDQRPMWYAGDYFGDRFAVGQPKAAK